MQLSKETREFAFRNPEIMRKMRFYVYIDIENCGFNQIMKFIKIRGIFIRDLIFDIKTTHTEEILRLIFGRLKNLENLNIYHLDFEIETSVNQEKRCKLCTLAIKNEIADLSKLKTLFIYQGAMQKFYSNTKNVYNLENISVKNSVYDNSKVINVENFADLISQQKNLIELNLIYSDSMSDSSPFQYIKNPVEFQLKKLSIDSYFSYFPNLVNFLKSHANSLNELDFNFFPGKKFADFMIKNLINLTVLKIKARQNSKIFSREFPQIKFYSLKYFKNYEEKGFMDLSNLSFNFPNVTHLFCVELCQTQGIFDKITFLELETLNCDNMKKIQLPNLVKLVFYILKLKNQQNLEIFAKNVPKVEHITMRGCVKITFERRCKNLCKNHKRNAEKLLICLEKFESLKNFHCFDYCIVDLRNKVAKYYGCLRPVHVGIIMSNLISYKIERIN